MTIKYRIIHNFRLTFQSKSRFSVAVKIPWLIENDYQRVLKIRTDPSAKIKRVKNDEWELINLKYSLDLPPRGSRTFSIETQLERLEFKLPVPISEIGQEAWFQKSRLPSHRQWPTDSDELYKAALESIQGSHSLLEVYTSLYRKTRSLIVPESLESRIGAYKAFKTGRGDCDEMTDLYITFCRCLGIQARRITGYHVDRETSAVENHAWAEVPCPGVKNAWLPVDPAMMNFASLPAGYIIKKVESNISQVNDITYKWKGKSTVSLSSDFTEKTVEITVLDEE